MQPVLRLLIVLLIVSCDIAAQDSINIAPGPEYQKSMLFRLLWGNNRRKEWTTAVRVPVVLLDTVYGGLKPKARGGGNETRSLQLVSAKGKHYSLRSINKSRDAVVPKLLRHSYFEMVIRDGVSMSFPYAALAADGMMRSCGIYHPKSVLVYVPGQAALDTFNSVFANDLYLLEERPDGDWHDGAPYLGGFDHFVSSTSLVDTMRKDPALQPDQFAFIKARLFDVLIGDWDRNGGNWKWGSYDHTPNRFIPIAKDRDQAFYTADGLLMKPLLRISRNGYMQHFSSSLAGINRMTKQDRAVDAIFTNAMTEDDWLHAAKEMQQALTDSVIERSVRGLPPEIFSICGQEFIRKLKSRRDGLEAAAQSLYKTLSRNVRITGTMGTDLVRVSLTADQKVKVQISRKIASGETEAPYYQRIFDPRDTKKITINGFGGDDIFEIDPAIRSIHIEVKKQAESTPPLKHSK